MNEDFLGRISRVKSENPIEQVARRLNLIEKGPRFFCPSCQSAGPSQHKSPDLAIYRETDSFFCFKCGERGDSINLVRITLNCSFKDACEWLTGDSFEKKHGKHLSSTTKRSPNNIITPIADLAQTIAKMAQEPYGAKGSSSFIPPKLERDLEPLLKTFQQTLPGSLGEQYFKSRGFSLDLCQCYSLGYSKPGMWPNKDRDWKYGRVVFPSYGPDGMLLNLYSRACHQENEDLAKHLRHDFLPGLKGYFPSDFYTNEEVIVTEGPFDTLALLASGYTNSVTINGLKSLRWDWLKNSKHIIFCFDADMPGKQELKRLAFEGILRGKTISSISPTVFRSKKDVADVFQYFGRITL